MLSNDRIHYLDSMRAILMILGILLHTANIFSPNHVWLVSSDDTSILFAGISGFINVFRMPAFFMVSGFFFTFIYLKKQRIDIKDRLLRLIVPLVFTALTLNVLQEILLKSHYDQPLNFSNFFSGGGWVSHLWFLVNLSIYNLVIWALFGLKPFHLVMGKTADFLSGRFAYLFAIAVFPFLISGIYGMNRLVDIYASFFNVTSPFLLLFYFQFFIVGLLFGYSQGLLNRFSNPGKKELITFALAYILSLFAKELATQDSLFYDVSGAYNNSLLILFLSSMCFYIFQRFLDYRNRALGLISASAYSIYLLHHIIVVALGIIFVNLPISIYIAYPVIVVLTFTLTMLAHQGITRSRILSFLLNGVRRRQFRNTGNLPVG
jgi:glucan biosynthesis protein C